MQQYIKHLCHKALHEESLLLLLIFCQGFSLQKLTPVWMIAG